MGNVMKKLSDDYEAEQLNPAWSTTKEGQASHEKIKDLLSATPEEAAVRMRVAVCEAIVEEIIDEKIDEDDGLIKAEELMSAVMPIVDKAVTLHLVPSAIKNRVAGLIAQRMRRVDPRTALLERAALSVTDAMIRMEADDTVISEILDEKADEVKLPDEVIHEDDDAIVPEARMPSVVEKSMRLLAASTVNTRKATAMVSRNCSGVLLDETLNALKNHLPEKFKQKYRLK